MTKIERRKVYIRKISDVAGFHIWYVNGFWIRKNIDEEFTNFGQHYRFKFIPKNELWIDRENGNTEAKYFIEHLLIENKLMEAGQKYSQAIDKASMIEKAERSKLRAIQKLEKEKNKEKVLKKVRKKLLKKLSTQIKIWIVRGDLVRSLYNIDFTQGGHDRVYAFIPKGEIWIDDDVYKKEIPFVLIHELHERYLMFKDKKSKTLKKAYNKAHKKASELEFFCRHNPNNIKKQLRLELTRNKL